MAVYRDFDYDLRINGKLVVNGDLSIPSSNLTISGIVSGSSFVGDGSQLTNLPIPSANSTPINGSTNPISADWAYDHSNSFGIGSHIPSGGDSTRFLRGDGTWQPVTTTDTNNYVTSISGNGNGTLYINRNGGLPQLTLSLSHEHSNYIKENDQNKVLGTGFSVKGALFVGTNGTYGNVAGSIFVRNTSGNNVIQIAGDGGAKQSGIKSYVNSNGDATFDGTLSGGILKVTDRKQVSNLNAEMVGGIVGSDIGRKQTAYELGGSGIHSGFNVTRAYSEDPNSLGAKSQFTIHDGIAYTSSGMRVEWYKTDYTISEPSTTTNSNRIDSIYVAGPSEGNNEGKINHVQGSYALSPIAPTIPSDGILLAHIYMGSNQGTITDDKITDKRGWKPVKYIDSHLDLDKARVNYITSYNSDVKFEKPIRNPKANTSLTFTSGQTSKTWTHNNNSGINYIVRFSCNSPEPHIYWSDKNSNYINIHLDDVCESDVVVDVSIEYY